MKTGAERIAAERERQRAKWAAAHDAEHDDGALAIVAAALAVYHTDAHVEEPHGLVDPLGHDAWGLIEKHRRDEVRTLEIAGALIAAEIDRLLAREVSRAE